MGALTGVTVLDITHVLSGPFCTYQLALLGADVLKIEDPRDPDCSRGRGPDADANAEGLGLNFQVQGGNKRAIALNLQDDAGRNILRRLASTADVLVENFSTGALTRLGLAYDDLSEINPCLIYCSITGYGDTGPEASTGAYDNVIQAASGTIAQCGGVKAGVSFIDYATGYAAAFAVTSALVQRGNTGKGCHISVSMLEVAMQMMSPEVAAVQHPRTTHREKEAGIQAYDTADGSLMLGVFKPKQYRKLSRLLSVPELSETDTWEDVWAIPAAVKEKMAETFRSRPTREWISLLRAADLPAEPVRTLTEAVTSPQLAARGYFQKNPGGTPETLPLTAFRMSDGGPELHASPPRQGQDTGDVLGALGFDAPSIADLVARGVIS